MDEELPDFLSDAATAAPETPQPVAEAQPTPQDAPQDPAATPVAEVAPEPAPEPAPTVVDPATGQHVPLPTFLDMRDRATAAEKRAKELENWRQQQEAAARRQPPPSLDEDPQGFHQHQAQQFDAALYSQRLTFSRSLAEVKHGADTVNAAFEWGAARCDQDPFFNQKVKSSPDPVGFVVDEWRRDQVASKVDPSELEAFLAWKAAQAQQPGQPAPAASAAGAQTAPPARPAAPRPSIAAAPSAGASAGPRGLDGDETFARMFGS